MYESGPGFVQSATPAETVGVYFPKVMESASGFLTEAVRMA